MFKFTRSIPTHSVKNYQDEKTYITKMGDKLEEKKT